MTAYVLSVHPEVRYGVDVEEKLWMHKWGILKWTTAKIALSIENNGTNDKKICDVGDGFILVRFQNKVIFSSQIEYGVIIMELRSQVHIVASDLNSWDGRRFLMLLIDHKMVWTVRYGMDS